MQEGKRERLEHPIWRSNRLYITMVLSQGLDQHFVVARFLSNGSKLCARALFSLFLFSGGQYLVLLFSCAVLQPFQEINKSLRMVKIRMSLIRHPNNGPRGSVCLWNPLWSCLEGDSQRLVWIRGRASPLTTRSVRGSVQTAAIVRRSSTLSPVPSVVGTQHVYAYILRAMDVNKAPHQGTHNWACHHERLCII
ncbi:hypothetical protein BDV37DRAFT_163841 [Aspergillus pseudonomiae]|uniref:Uncharacterized protein n=1 Tax=Aspergillus pseudonomiae TaxID=1506151 RepID=A0A5N7D8S5_9EURO|nr:uncharacterized protein BDV37DRAFT_163841 [Aspergillus pseudonomiae]KAE8402168.1 hypothetical protein BDV37DRAFT_163841 [Aspergillus pseudonomiae]